MLVEFLKAAIADRIDPKRKTGIALSGGLDSSTVAALAPPLPTFTGYYDLPGFDERRWSRLAAKDEDQQHEIKITPKDFVAHFDEMRSHLRPPIMGMGSFGQFMVAKYASKHVEVMLSGEGSDELFGGYARQMMVAGYPPPEGYEGYQLPEGYPRTLRGALAYDYAMLPDLLAVDDQMAGAFGIEARAPFTDERVVRYGLALPISERIGKRHLRAAVRGIVPDAIIDRKEKMGFPAPLVSWAQVEPVRSFVKERIGYLPDPAKPWARDWWYDLCR